MIRIRVSVGIRVRISRLVNPNPNPNHYTASHWHPPTLYGAYPKYNLLQGKGTKVLLLGTNLVTWKSFVEKWDPSVRSFFGREIKYRY